MDNVKKIKFNSNNKGFEIIALEDFFKETDISYIRKHFRTDFYSLIYITDGECIHEVDFIEYKIKAGEVLLVSRNRIHKYSEFQNVKGYLIMFTEGFLCEFLSNNTTEAKELFRESYMNPYISFTSLCKYNLELKNLLDLIINMYKNIDSVISYEVIANTLKSFIMILFKCILDEDNLNRKNENFIQFTELVEKYIDKEKTVEGYADMMYVSKKTVNSITRKAIDMSAKQYIIQQLILKIKLKLCFEQKSIKEISNDLGFKEASNMTRFFKKYTSISPLEFRKINRDINNKRSRSNNMDLDKIREEIEKKVYHITSETKVPLHEHAAQDEVFYCIKGSGIGVLEDKEVEVNVGDTFIAQAGNKHSLKTDGDMYVTAFLIPANRIVCNCKQVSYGEIRKAMVEGARTVEDIQRITGAGTGCGGCIEDIKKILSVACGCKDVSMNEIEEAIKAGADTVEKISKKTGAGSECGNCKKLIQNMIDMKK